MRVTLIVASRSPHRRGSTLSRATFLRRRRERWRAFPEKTVAAVTNASGKLLRRGTFVTAPSRRAGFREGAGGGWRIATERILEPNRVRATVAANPGKMLTRRRVEEGAEKARIRRRRAGAGLAARSLPRAPRAPPPNHHLLRLARLLILPLVRRLRARRRPRRRFAHASDLPGGSSDATCYRLTH